MLRHARTLEKAGREANHPALKAWLGETQTRGLATRTGLSSGFVLGAMPIAAWFGGLLAALYVVAIVVLTPRLGVGLTTGFILAGQVISAILLDHFGPFENPEHPLNGWRLLGALFMIVGVVLIKAH